MLDDFLAFIVHAVVVEEIAALLRGADGPAGEAARYFGHILLRVAAVDTQGVQFHQFAAVVFIQSTRMLVLLRRH